tara:strand:+ start:1801 stop:3543 length:1743 start_codon:yes stop_codon:yes gene_type:complete
MKKILLLVILNFLIIHSCTEMDSIHGRYLDGEIVYSGKLDSIQVRSGYYRVQVDGQTRFLGNSKKIYVEFEERKESFQIDEEVEDIFSFIIENLDEQTYEFNIQTEDEYQNLSVPQIVSGKSVGETFVDNQESRKLSEYITKSDGYIYANFAGNSESPNVLFTILNYQLDSGDYKYDTVFVNQREIRLEEFIPNSKIKAISYVKSGDNGIDTIELNQVEYELPNLPYDELDKRFISLVEMPSDISGATNGAKPSEYLFDGDNTWEGNDEKTFLSSAGTFPHHFTIDLGVNTTLRKVKLDMPNYLEFNDNNITSLQIWGRRTLSGAETYSNTEESFISSGWKLLKEQDIDGENISSASFMIDPNLGSFRYIRYRVLSTVTNNSSQLTELTFFGQDNESIFLDKSFFSMPTMQSDNPGNFYSAEPSNYLYDDNYSWGYSDKYGYHSGENSVPGHFTLDLGVYTQLSKVELHFRPTYDYSGNNPTTLEIWGRNDLNEAEILPVFSFSGNKVTSPPASSESLENANWIKLSSTNINGAYLSFSEFEVEPNEMVRFLKIRYVKTVGGSGCQLIEVTFKGNGAIKP